MPRRVPPSGMGGACAPGRRLRLGEDLADGPSGTLRQMQETRMELGDGTMAKRTKKNQTAHDKGVQAQARKLDQDGWEVHADVSGWPNPPTINGRIPDVYATKRGSRRIVEVETDPDEDQKQHETFRRHAGQKHNTRLDIVVVDAGGREMYNIE